MLDALAIGDIHLDKLSNLFPDNHLELQSFELDKAMHYAIKEGIKHVFFLGDVCENSRMSSDAEEVFMRFLGKWDGKLNSYFILGNHDWDEVGVHSLRPFVTMYEMGLFKTTHVLAKPEVRKIDGVKVNFQSYPGTTSYRDHVNIGHFEVSGSTRDNGRKIGKATDVRSKHLWIMGHLHTPHTVGDVWYSGTLYQMNFGESLPKGFMRVRAKMKDGALKYKVDRVKNDPRFKLINVRAESKKDLRVLDDNPLNRFRLIVKEGFDVPEDIMERYPNIVKREGYATKEEFESVVQEAFLEIKKQTIMLPPMEEMLTKFLVSKGATKQQIKRGRALLEKITPRAKE